MVELAHKTSVVMCPGCKTPMKPVGHKPILSSNGMTDVTYVCETCGTKTVRTIRNHDK